MVTTKAMLLEKPFGVLEKPTFVLKLKAEPHSLPNVKCGRARKSSMNPLINYWVI